MGKGTEIIHPISRRATMMCNGSRPKQSCGHKHTRWDLRSGFERPGERQGAQHAPTPHHRRSRACSWRRSIRRISSATRSDVRHHFPANGCRQAQDSTNTAILSPEPLGDWLFYVWQPDFAARGLIRMTPATSRRRARKSATTARRRAAQVVVRTTPVVAAEIASAAEQRRDDGGCRRRSTRTTSRSADSAQVRMKPGARRHARARSLRRCCR